jgi:hypothetical protein
MIHMTEEFNGSYRSGLIHVTTHCSLRLIVIYNVYCQCCAINSHLMAFTVPGRNSGIS